jgi:SAM-dependent methyltransferase
VFDNFVTDLVYSLKREGIEFHTGPRGEILEESVRIGRVVKWKPPTQIEIEWKAAAVWDSNDSTTLRVRFEPVGHGKRVGTKITVENEGWGKLLGDRGPKLSEWFEDEIVTHFLKETSPKRFTSWLTDRRARKPTGASARTSYRDPTHHRPGFKAMLHYLELTMDDYLLEVGCGGGAFLADALQSGCRAAAIDHSPEMVEVSRDLNSEAVSKKRLEIVQAEADSIPYPNETFSCVASANVFGFVEDPAKVLSEIYRVLKRGGKLVLTTGSKESKGTIASPYPIACLLHFYSEPELIELAKKAGFEQARVERPDLGPFAIEANIPRSMRKFFSGNRGLFLLANKN